MCLSRLLAIVFIYFRLNCTSLLDGFLEFCFVGVFGWILKVFLLRLIFDEIFCEFVLTFSNFMK